MKTNILLLLFYILITSTIFSQDVIVRKDGVKIDAKVFEITLKTIKYKNSNHLEGPLRNIKIEEVKEIKYEDGTIEKISKTSDVKGVLENKRLKEFIFKSGLYLNVVVGVATIHQKYDYINFKTYYDFGETVTIKPDFETKIQTGVNFEVGYNWIFGRHKKWRPGFRLTFINIGVITDFNQSFGMRTMASLGHVGYSNTFKLTQNSGVVCHLKVVSQFLILSII